MSRVAVDVMMRITDGTMIITPSGVLGSGDLGAWRGLIESLPERKIDRVLIDGSEIDWMSSEGLALLVKMNKACEEIGRKFAISGLNKSTRESIELVNLHMILTLI